MDQLTKDKLCKQIDAEIDKISVMPTLTDVALGNLYKLIEVKKGLLKIDVLEGELEGMMGMEEGYSNRGQYSNRGGYSRRGNSYAGGNGMARADASNHYMGNPIYDPGYSMAAGDAYMHLEEAMRAARTDREREAIRLAMSKM